MINGGYVLQPRCIDESEVIDLPPVTRELWFYLIRKVNHKEDGKFKRGQGFFNLGRIRDDLCWSVGYRKEKYSKPQLTKSVQRLRDRNMIETTKATRGIFVTIINYDYYQNPKNYERNNEGTTKETRRKRSGHTKNKNDNNERIMNKSSVKTNLTAARNVLNEVYTYFEVEVINGLTENQKEEWVDTIDKLNRIDGYSFEEIKKIIIWGRENDFWSKNFQAIPPLRKKKDGVSKFLKIKKSMEYEENKSNNGKNRISEEKAREIAKTLHKNFQKYGCEV